MTLEPWRAAQIVVDRGAGGGRSRGSGYLIAPGCVLTAAHVVAGASSVRVLLDVGHPAEIDAPALTWWADPGQHEGSDLAVITIAADAGAGRECERARFGRIGDSAAVLPVQALGFPRFKVRAGHTDATRQPREFRDSEQVIGHAPVAANRRQGTVAVYLDGAPPADATPGEPSPWEGMSGAAVWSGDRIIGVVAKHHRSEGAGRLTARRIDRAYELRSATELGRLAGLLGLPSAADGLPDVVPADLGQLVRSAYLAQVQDIAPDALIGRENELADLAEFCAGPEAYAWWQAGPWAGKSALASWFVLNPPAGVDVVSFFITGRLSGQADSGAFLDAMIEQLSALSPPGSASPPVSGARAGAWLHLLERAAARAAELGRRLAVVVDGLDEDDAGATPARGRPSIASLLPRRPPPGARFMVTSRPSPGLPDDVPGGHPLRTATPRRLPPSGVAEDIELLAKQELRELLSGDQVSVDVVGYVAGSGGGLSGSDLSALIGAPPHRLDPVLRGVFGRSLYTRASHDPRNLATRVYLFAHETLRVIAEEQLGDDLARYRQRVHDWITAFAAAGWPDTTPGYAIRGYPRMLAATADVERLAALARDPGRHAFLLRATGSDYAALTEIRTAQGVIADQEIPDLPKLVELAVCRHAISLRNRSIPHGLPAAWARLGRLDHAEALAQAAADPLVLADLAGALAEAGHAERGAALARAITDPSGRASALAELARVAGQAGDFDRGEALAGEIAQPAIQALALARLARASAQAAEPGRARRLACQAEPVPGAAMDEFLAEALTDAAVAIAETGQIERAERMVIATADHSARAEAATGLAAAIARAGDIARAESLARRMDSEFGRARAFAVIAAAAADAGDLPTARRLADNAESCLAAVNAVPEEKAWALAELAVTVSRAGEPGRTPWTDWTRRITDRAQALARDAADGDAQTPAADLGNPIQEIFDPRPESILARLAIANAQAGDLDRAEDLLSAITGATKGRALVDLSAAIARRGDPARAEALARAAGDPATQAWALTAVAAEALRAGDPGRAQRMAGNAEALARSLTAELFLDDARGVLAVAAAKAGDLGRATTLAGTVVKTETRDWAFAQVAACAATRDPARAEAAARAINDDMSRAVTLADLATAAARAGHLDGAGALCRLITDPSVRDRALAEVAVTVADSGRLDHAESLADAPADAAVRVSALAGLAVVSGRAGDPGRAQRLADRAEELARSSAEPEARAWALANVAIAVAMIGDLDRAEALARAVTEPEPAGRAPAYGGPPGRTPGNTEIRDQALEDIAVAAAQAGGTDRAEELAGAIEDPDGRARAFARLAAVIVQTGDTGRARRLASRAWVAGTEPIPPGALTDLATVIALSRDIGQAEALAQAESGHDGQDRVRAELATAFGQAGELDEAERFALAVDDPDGRAAALTELVTAAAVTGDTGRAARLADRAEDAARAVVNPDNQAVAFTRLVVAIAQAGDLDRASRVLAAELVLGPPHIWWVEGVAQFFPSVILGSLDILVSAFPPAPRLP